MWGKVKFEKYNIKVDKHVYKIFPTELWRPLNGNIYSEECVTFDEKLRNV